MKILKWSNVNKTILYLKKNGVRHAFYAAKERIEEEKKDTYVYLAPLRETLEAQRREAAEMPWLFSIVVPTYETDEGFLREMIDSVCAQTYPNWELLLADASGTDRVEKEARIHMAERGDGRIRYLRLETNAGIAENTNAGIREATGDYIALLDHDDLLAPDALYRMAEAVKKAMQNGTAPELLYSDEDKYDSDSGAYFQPNIKENFNLDLILSNNYICHFMAVKAERMKSLLLRKEYDGAQDYDLVLRVVQRLLHTMPPTQLARQIVHVPEVLYHWRCHAASTAQNTASKSYAYEAGRRALADFCRVQGWKATVENSLHLGFYRVVYEPDLLAVREDVGIVGGRLLDPRGHICGGIYDREGMCPYQGLHKEYSGGSTHRASLVQDCCTVDIRCLRVREELWGLYRELTGLVYREKEVGKGRTKTICADLTGLSCDEAGYRDLSRKLCAAAADAGYLVVWDPGVSRSL